MVFTIRRTAGHRHTIIAVTGTVDAAATAPLREALNNAMLTGAAIHVDLVAATSIDHAAVATLIAAQRQATLAGASLLLRTTPAQLPMLLEAIDIAPNRRSSKPRSVPRRALRHLLSGTGIRPDRTVY
jgi:anti-anti-sigma regulatory factor